MKDKNIIKKNIRISGRTIGPGYPVFIIAEAGVNHNGSLSLAKKMVDAAKSAGADAVKFQTYKTENLVTAECPKAAYQKKSGGCEPQFDMLKRLELSRSQFEDLFYYCKKKNIIFLSTPFDQESAEFLYRLGVPAFKISSGDVSNIPFLRKVAGYKRPVILSTGMSTMAEIKDALRCMTAAGNHAIALLHCTSNYPAKFVDVNLSAMGRLNDTFKVPTGYSDHTLGIEISVAAVAAGAVIIEKHFTLNKKLPGPDQSASIEPMELRNMVRSIRNVEKAVGDGIKRPRNSELEIAKVVRKSLVAAEDIPQGSRISSPMVSVKRPGTGIAPKYFDDIVNRTTKVTIKKDSVLNWGMFK